MIICVKLTQLTQTDFGLQPKDQSVVLSGRVQTYRHCIGSGVQPGRCNIYWVMQNKFIFKVQSTCTNVTSRRTLRDDICYNPLQLCRTFDCTGYFPLLTGELTWYPNLYFWLNVVSGCILFDEVFHHRKNSIDIILLSRSKLILFTWGIAFCSLREWVGNFCNVLRENAFKTKMYFCAICIQNVEYTFLNKFYWICNVHVLSYNKWLCYKT